MRLLQWKLSVGLQESERSCRGNCESEHVGASQERPGRKEKAWVLFQIKTPRAESGGVWRLGAVLGPGRSLGFTILGRCWQGGGRLCVLGATGYPAPSGYEPGFGSYEEVWCAQGPDEDPGRRRARRDGEAGDSSCFTSATGNDDSFQGKFREEP
ncbi:unnamed protein product [Pleuronectes platessa]|uniref:Uncharacterized protein n=1 Tax=Pleuronectes platessa TaxID=8262 RepID=A0A9N7UT14_PLEPL|nr:unnamed protein product [Pleuronectes platessa]